MSKKITLGALLVLMTVFTAQADAPQPVVIQTQVVFLPLPEGTFTASAPLCASGTFRAVSLVSNPSVAHGWTARHEYTCDDNSGTFIIQFHPQAGKNYAQNPQPEFTVAGPWQIVEGGTGRYTKLTGHGDLGVVIDFSTEPWTGEETFVGFVQLK
jgi:hypothetical protein